jgi:hypothetical protein
MALIGRRVKRFTGTITTDGAGAGVADITQGSAGGVAVAGTTPSYKLIRVDISQGAAPLTGGTVVIRDNSGAGSAVNTTVTVGSGADQLAATAGAHVSRTFAAPTPVTNVRLTIAGGGATKTIGYRAVFARTRAH